jgi:DNA-binding transcriptional MocR family regulator
VPALQGLDRHGLVLYSGSFSKVLFPSIRLGYLARRGVEVTPLSRYYRGYHRGRMAREGLHLGFAAVDPREIRRGVEELGVALEGEG